LLRTFQADSPVKAVAFSTDGTRVLAVSEGDPPEYLSATGIDGMQQMWDAASGQVLRSASVDLSPGSAAFSRDGNQIVVAGTKSICLPGICFPSAGSYPIIFESINLLDAVTEKVLHSIRSEPRSVAISPDGARIVSGGEDKTISLWDATNEQLLQTFNGHSGAVWSVAFSPDGSRVLSGSADKTIKLWNATNGQLLQTFNGHSDGVASVALSPDGSRVLSGSADGKMKLWNATSGQLLKNFE
jgi:WD40 repeat protein